MKRHPHTFRYGRCIDCGRSLMEADPDACGPQPPPRPARQLTVTVDRHTDGTLHSTVTFPGGQTITASAVDPDLGFDEVDNVLHDLAHTLITCRRGLERSPVLERVVDLRPLSQRDVDIEELATFALQALCAAVSGRDPQPALDNAQASLLRLSPGDGEQAA